MKDRSSGFPSRVVPMGCACPQLGVITWAGLLHSHSEWLPEWHWKQPPQGIAQFNKTRSPGRNRVTPDPTSRTTPAPSCPITSGRFQRSEAWSVWQMPAARISINTSPPRGDATSISSISNPPMPSAMAAKVLMVRRDQREKLAIEKRDSLSSPPVAAFRESAAIQARVHGNVPGRGGSRGKLAAF